MSTFEGGGDSRRRLVKSDAERESFERFENSVAGDGKIVPDLGPLVESATQRNGVALVVEGFFGQLGQDLGCGHGATLDNVSVGVFLPCVASERVGS